MALLNFLYKDESFIASLYAQVFSGKLVQVALENSVAKKIEANVKGDVLVASGAASGGRTSVELHREVVDPHDAATLDVLNHLDPFCVSEEECTRGDIVKMSGELFLYDYKAREALIDFGFDSNRGVFDKALGANISNKKHRNTIIDLAKSGCVGEKDEIRFFFKSNSEKWYWGSLYKHNLALHMSTLMMVNGANGIPISLIAMHVGDSNRPEPTEDTESSLGFSRSLQSMTAMTNTILASGIDLSAGLIPIALVVPINARAENEQD